MRYPELMLEKESKQLYHEWLTKDCHSKKKCQVRSGLELYLGEVYVKLFDLITCTHVYIGPKESPEPFEGGGD